MSKTESSKTYSAVLSGYLSIIKIDYLTCTFDYQYTFIAEYKYSVESLFCQSSRLFVGTRSGHIVVIDSDSLSLVSTFHGFCENVTSIFAVPKSTWNLLPADYGHTTDEDDASSEPSSLVPYLVSLGIGLQSYAREQVNRSGTGFMLVWNIDSV